VLALAATLSGLSWLLVSKGVTLAHQWTVSLGPRGPASAVFSAVGSLTERFGVPPEELAARARAFVASAAERAAVLAEAIVATTAGGLLALFFAMLSMHFILRNWSAVALRAQEAFPLRPDYTAALFTEFRRVGRSTLLGTIGSGVAQGILATIGYWICGVPEPLFFGAATAVASLVPAVGAALVWVPVGIAMILAGETTRGILELVWGGALVAALCDYVIRPRLVGGDGSLPSIMTFAALLGGVQVFGLKGLIVGPVLMSLAVAVLRLYATEARKRRSDLLARAG
jgi:predicted PurR-regulated permease PerM